ncbi:MAG: PQQ-binding-like beta-propeller repeat protein [Candidatus Sulfotelmatobacter sp.]
MRSTTSKVYGPCLVFSVVVILAGCGSNSSNSAPSTRASTPVGISLNQTTANIDVGTTTQFTATVTGATNTAVTWSVDSVSGGNDTAGTVSAAGLYTAPSVAGMHTVAATSVANTSASAKATVTVVGPMSVTPGSAVISAGLTQQFSATVPGSSNASANWSVDQIAGGNSTVGTISTTGLYTAPSTVGNHTITATTASSPSTSASAAIAIFTISISPSAAEVALSPATEQFTATVQGVTSPVLTWSVDQISDGNATVGTISAAGLYAAPFQPGSHTITAGIAGATGSADAAVTVVSFTVSPTATTVDPSTSQQFTATLQGSTSSSVAWSVDGVAGGNAGAGTISSSGLYTAPATAGSHTITATTTVSTSVSANATLTVINDSPGAVLTYHNDDARDGAFTQETTLTPANVNQTQFGKLFSYPVDGQIYGQPLYLPQVRIGGVVHDVVFVATQNNTVYALDASVSQTLWTRNLGPSVTKNDYSGVNPVVGILATPVIDATTNTIYVFAEISGGPFYLYALDVATGAEKFGGPVAVTATVPGTGLDSSGGNISLESDCYQRMGLALNPVTNAIYIAFGSCNHGWVLAYDKTTLKQTAIFNDTADGGGGGLWASGGAPAIDDSTGDLYLMSGTDSGDQQWITGSTQVGYNDSFLRLSATDLSVLDYFSPDNNYNLAVSDADLGSGSNVLMPDNASSTPHETIGGGKDGNIFVVNRDSMGGFNDGTNNVIQTVQTGSGAHPDNNIFSTPVYWNGTIYYHCNGDMLRAYSWNANTGLLSTTPTSVGATAYGKHGATASLSSNGAASGIIWDIDNSAYNGTTPASSGTSVLHAYDATNVATELYNSSQAGTRDTAGLALKFTVPTIAGGRVFVPTASELDIYGLLP